jgi:hypothetical protein
LRIARIAPPWFPLPPHGYGGIEWIVLQLADELTRRGHDITLFAPPGSRSEAQVESPLPAEAPRGSIGDVWYQIMHDFAVYDQAQEFDIIRDHSKVVGPSIGAISSHRRVVNTIHGRFTDQTRRLYSALGRKLWFVAISDSQRRQAPTGCAGSARSRTASPSTSTPSAPTRRTTSPSSGGLAKRRHLTWRSRRHAWRGGP